MRINMKYFKKLSALLITLIVIGMVSGAFATESINDNGKTIYVAINGNDANDGLTCVTAKKTIQNAINTAKNGDTIRVAQGKYQENLLINQGSCGVCSA
jgi:pectin methylesterase-like acyl-CoA thioesterase